MISKTYSPHQGVAVSSSSIHCIPLAKQMSILFTQDARWSQESNGLQTNGVQAAWSVGDVMLVFCYFCWLWDWRWLTLSCRSQKKWYPWCTEDMEQAYGLHWLSGFGRKGALHLLGSTCSLFNQVHSFVLFCGLPVAYHQTAPQRKYATVTESTG